MRRLFGGLRHEGGDLQALHGPTGLVEPRRPELLRSRAALKDVFLLEFVGFRV